MFLIRADKSLNSRSGSREGEGGGVVLLSIELGVEVKGRGELHGCGRGKVLVGEAKMEEMISL